mmetsp:Transcript_15831/g.43948  ORF Transcript_15831/g.43948 Transcript_15831/m.43948 type:complete len:231 (-) Transcript_15831:88-780(-)
MAIASRPPALHDHSRCPSRVRPFAPPARLANTHTHARAASRGATPGRILVVVGAKLVGACGPTIRRQHPHEQRVRYLLQQANLVQVEGRVCIVLSADGFEVVPQRRAAVVVEHVLVRAEREQGGDHRAVVLLPVAAEVPGDGLCREHERRKARLAVLAADLGAAAEQWLEQLALAVDHRELQHAGAGEVGALRQEPINRREHRRGRRAAVVHELVVQLAVGLRQPDAAGR